MAMVLLRDYLRAKEEENEDDDNYYDDHYCDYDCDHSCDCDTCVICDGCDCRIIDCEC